MHGCIIYSSTSQVCWYLACITNRLDQYLEEWEKELEDEDAILSYDQFQHIEKVKDDGTKTTVMDRVEVTTDIQSFLKEFKLRLRTYIQHVHTWRWQAHAYDACHENLPEDHIMVALDFAENHTFLEKEEVQTLHWSSNQATILPMVVHRHAKVTDEEGNIKDEVIKEHFVFISDDRKKDTEFVMHAFGILFQYLEDKGVKPKHTHIWSDGCAGQFKSHNAFMDKSLFLTLYGCSCDHNFFCSGHGKGEWDGVGATCKHCAALAVVQGKCVLQNSGDLHRFLAETLSTAKPSTFPSRQFGGKVKNRLFFLIKAGEIRHEDRSIVDIKTIKDLRKHHQFYFSGHASQKVRYRRFTCMCRNCIKFDWRNCLQPEWVPAHRTSILKTKHSRTQDTVSRCFQSEDATVQPSHVARQKPPSELQMIEDDDVLDLEEGEKYTPVWQLVKAVRLPRSCRSDDFEAAVSSQLARFQMANVIVMFDDPAYEEHYQYFIFRCTEGPTVLDCTTVDDYRQKFNKGAVVFKGYYFTLATDADGKVADQTTSRTYVLASDKLALVAVESICYAGFTMIDTGVTQGLPILGHYQRVYQVEKDVHEEALQAVRAGKRWVYDDSDDEEGANRLEERPPARPPAANRKKKGPRQPAKKVAQKPPPPPALPVRRSMGTGWESDSDVDGYEEQVWADGTSSCYTVNDD